MRTVRLNPKAGSVIVTYDVDSTDPQRVLGFLEAELVRLTPYQPVAKRDGPRQEGRGAQFTAEVGRMALNLLVQRGVNFSLSTLLCRRA